MPAAVVASLAGDGGSWGVLILWAVLSGLVLGAAWRASLRAYSWHERRAARRRARELVGRARDTLETRLVPMWRRVLAAEPDEGKRREMAEVMVAKVRRAFGDDRAEQVRAALAGPADPPDCPAGQKRTG